MAHTPTTICSSHTHFLREIALLRSGQWLAPCLLHIQIIGRVDAPRVFVVGLDSSWELIHGWLCTGCRLRRSFAGEAAWSAVRTLGLNMSSPGPAMLCFPFPAPFLVSTSSTQCCPTEGLVSHKCNLIFLGATLKIPYILPHPQVFEIGCYLTLIAHLSAQFQGLGASGGWWLPGWTVHAPAFGNGTRDIWT